MLSLTFLMALPSPTITSVKAVPQAGQTAWSPFGPNSDRMLIKFYSDFSAMFTAFTNGEIDITDWPVPPTQLSSFSSNPDFFLTTSEGEFGIRHININQNGNFLGIAQQVARVFGPAGIKNQVLSATTCGTGFAQLTVNLHNQELSGKPLILDNLTSVIASSTSGTFSSSDTNLVSPTGQFKINGGACIPQNAAYTLSTNVYGGTATIPITSQNTFTVDFNVNWNSQSNKAPTAAAIQINRGVAHLLDTKSFIDENQIAGQAVNPHFWSPPAQGYHNVCTVNGNSANAQVCQATLNIDCSAHSWVTTCAMTAPYNLKAPALAASAYSWAAQGSSLGVDKGYPSADDLRAACDHFVAAGLTLVGGTCLDVANALNTAAPLPATYAHLSNNGQQIVVLPRTDPQRRDHMAIVADALNALFGTPNNANNPANPAGQQGCTVNYVGPSQPGECAFKAYTITQIFDQVFSNNLGAGANDWKLYNGGNTLGTFGDDTYFEYNTVDNGGLCAGAFSTYQLNYNNYCDPILDTWTHAGEFAKDINTAGAMFKRGFLLAVQNEWDVAVFSASSQFVGLNSWNFQPGPQSSLVQQLGAGFQVGFQSLLNMRCNPLFTPTLAQYACGGGTGGTPELIRRGFSQDVHKLSPFAAQSVWEFETLLQVYDSMLATNPRTGGAASQIIDWQTTSHTASFDPNEISCLAPSQGGTCLPGTTTQVWHLRNGLKFHDNFPLTADDVCYTLTSYRDVPAANLGVSVQAVTSCVVNSASTLTVKLQGQSPFFEVQIGGEPIIPKHTWAPKCGVFPYPQPNPCADPAFDPMAAGFYIGDGPWECDNINTGAHGGSCSQNADGSIGGQDVTLNGRIVLNKYMQYHRGNPGNQRTILHQMSWADKNGDGTINILDIADAALHFGSHDWYWDNRLFGTTDGTVDIGEIATIASLFDSGITKPFAPSALFAMDPAINPYSGHNLNNIDMACTGAGGSAATGSILSASILCTDLSSAILNYEGFNKDGSGLQTGNVRILVPAVQGDKSGVIAGKFSLQYITSAGSTVVVGAPTSVLSDGTTTINGVSYNVWDSFWSIPGSATLTNYDVVCLWNGVRVYQLGVPVIKGV
ncbi:hypothetical protein E6H29_07960 [Candidatus Bathyarchaeota archaeon]|nr:MAG: hypothetical protein E6H29_07960 [Candidatus Bathyarchaeota archaeon]